MSMKNTFSAAQYVRCCAVPLCGSEYGVMRDTVCVAPRVVAGWDRWDNVRGCAPWEGGPQDADSVTALPHVTLNAVILTDDWPPAPGLCPSSPLLFLGPPWPRPYPYPRLSPPAETRRGRGGDSVRSK